MLRTSKVLTVSLPPEMLNKAEKIAKEESRTRSELFREALRQYIANRERWQEIRKWGTQTAKKYSIKSEADVDRLVQEFRKENK